MMTAAMSNSENGNDSTSWGGEPSDSECPVAAVIRTQEESRRGRGGSRRRRQRKEVEKRVDKEEDEQGVGGGVR